MIRHHYCPTRRQFPTHRTGVFFCLRLCLTPYFKYLTFDPASEVNPPEYQIVACVTLDISRLGVSGLDALSVVRGLRPQAILAIVSAYTRDMDPDAVKAEDVVL